MVNVRKTRTKRNRSLLPCSDTEWMCEHSSNPRRIVEIATSDPLPPLLAILEKYANVAYMGRGTYQDDKVVDTRKLWTGRWWKDVAEGIPDDGLLLVERIIEKAVTTNENENQKKKRKDMTKKCKQTERRGGYEGNRSE